MFIGCGLLVIGYWLLVRMQIDRTVYLTIIPKTKNQKPTSPCIGRVTARFPPTDNLKPKTNNQHPQ